MPGKKKRQLVAIILAAGQGTRMNSQIPKVLHSICGTPMIDHILDALRPLDVAQTYVVTGHLHNEVKKHIGTRAICIYQKERRGTAHAVRMVRNRIRNFDGDVLVLYGDTPLIQTETLQALIHRRRSHHSACTVLTTTLDDPTGYGRIVRNRDGTVRKIVEEKDTNTYEEKIREINTGFYCYNAHDLLWSLARVSNDNAQGEYYLTDTVEILGEAGREVEGYVALDPSEVIGVNSRRDMAVAEKYLRTRILRDIMDRGVTIVDPSTTYIDNTVRIGIDTTIQPFTIIRGNTVIGEGCEIGPNVTLTNCRLGAHVLVRNSVVESASADDNVSIGPYAYVRPGTLLREGARVGTFVEVARSDIGRNADALHLSYLGDAHVGEETYIGAGTMTGNFDGQSIHRSEIGKGVFIGSNSLLVSPVRIRDAVRLPPNSTVTGEVAQPDRNARMSTRENRSRNSTPEEASPPPRRTRSSSSASSPATKKAAPRKTASPSSKSGKAAKAGKGKKGSRPASAPRKKPGPRRRN